MPKNTAEHSAKAKISSRAVRQQVERLCRSEDFADSPRAVRFLQFVVKQVLAGRADELSQRLLAKRVFGREELDFIAQGLGSELAAALDSYQTARVLLLQLRPDFRESGPRLIRHYVKFEDLAYRIEDALELAGMDLTRIAKDQ